MIKSEQPIMVGCLLLIYKKNENRVTRIPFIQRGFESSPLFVGKSFAGRGMTGIKITEKILYFKLFILLLFSVVERKDFVLDPFYK